eukprot:145108_1
MSCMVDVEGTKTNDVNTNKLSLVSYLKKYKLPTKKFVSLGVDINDLINFDHQYFKGLCNDMELSNLESMRFAKLIQELNQDTNNEDNCTKLIKEIRYDSEIASKTIDISCDKLMDTLNQRRKELKQKLNEITQQNIDYIMKNKATLQNTSRAKNKHIEFIAKDFSSIKNILSMFGKITDSNIISNHIKPVSFSLFIPTDNVCSIGIQIEENKNENINYEIEYKEAKSDNWNAATDSLLISNNNIKPLTLYMIRMRYGCNIDNETIFKSKWSEIQSIRTKFDCIWDRKYHGKNIELINDYEIFVNGNNNSYCCSSIVCKYMLSRDIFKKIKYAFIFDEFCQPSMFGFVKHPINVTMKSYWNNNNCPLIENKYSFLVAAMDGLKYIHRYQNGKDTESGMLSIFNNGITLKKPIAKGDHFIFDIDFDLHCCNLYINDENYKVCTKKNESTWTNIPNKIIPVYSHYCDSKLVQKNSRVKLNLIHYELR